ncbi:MAG: HIT family protein [Caulobacterales bacterium]|jgi:histidine triad (HIT) family protein
MSLTGAYDDANIFAKIIRGEMPAMKVFEDDVVVSFLDIFPQSRGHTLVIPKRVRARNFLDLPAAEVGPLMERLQRIAHGVNAALKPDGITLLQYNGAPAGQTVFHLHFHVIPRYDGEPLAGHGQAPKADAEMLKEQADRIAAAIA